MINRKTGQAIIEIPKSGSRSLVEAAIQGYGKKVFAYHGHHTLAELVAMYPEPITNVVAVVREPEERFYSQINEYMRIKKASIDDAFKACIEQSHVIFTPQYKFLMGLHKFAQITRPLENCLDAQTAAYGGPMKNPIHKNDGAARRSVSEEQVFGHPDTLKALEMFVRDYALYSAIKRHTLDEEVAL